MIISKNSDDLFLNIFTKLQFIDDIYLDNVVSSYLAYRTTNSINDIVWGYYTPQLLFINKTLTGTIMDNNSFSITYGEENTSIKSMYTKTDNYRLITIFHAMNSQFSFSFNELNMKI